MKISNVRVYVIDAQIERGGRYPRQWIFVRIDTDEGITGWGEASSYPHNGSFMAGLGVLSQRDWLIGQDPSQIEPIWHRMFRRFTSVGAKGIASAAVSGVDIALWDIRGKALGLPVYELLGGKFRDHIDLYANGWFPNCETPEDYARAARERVLPAGHTALKFDPYKEFELGYTVGGLSEKEAAISTDRVVAVREAVGPHHEVLIDGHGRFNVPRAVELANQLYDAARIGWFEEPVPAESYSALAQVRPHIRARISVGERLFTRFDFAPILEAGLTDYVMPDICLAGGISEMRRIANLAETYHVPFSPHNAQGPIQIVAGAQVCMSIPNFYRLEHAMDAIPAYNRYLTEPLNFHDGQVTIPARPGLGVEVNAERVEAEAIHPDWSKRL
jgi:galactonate dehydratase